MILLFFLLGLWPIQLVAEPFGTRATVEYLSSSESRLAGYPGSDQAAEYLENCFRDMGFLTYRDTFTGVVPVDKGGRLEWEDESVVLHALWPNSARTSTVPPEGIRVPAIWAGGGDWVDYNGKEVVGRAVVLDFESRGNWIKAASLGARAIIFIAPETVTNRQAKSKYAAAPLDVPRFWLERKEGERLKRRLQEGELEVALWGRMDWEQRPAWNVWAEVPGADPALDTQTVLIHAYYDAPSLVPALAPGAEASVSAAVLLQVAQQLQRRPPARRVRLAARTSRGDRAWSIFSAGMPVNGPVQSTYLSVSTFPATASRSCCGIIPTVTNSSASSSPLAAALQITPKLWVGGRNGLIALVRFVGWVGPAICLAASIPMAR